MNMFSQVAEQYDTLNHMFSLWGDLRWRKASARLLNFSEDDHVLDFGCGTGDFTFALRKHSALYITAIDLSPEMLDLMKNKTDNDTSNWLKLMAADGEDLPFDENTFDGAVAGFVGRNLLDLHQGLSDIHRVVKPDGRIGFLEFCKPDNGLMRVVSWLYFRLVVAPFGNLFMGKSVPAYRYLIDTIEAFYSTGEMRSFLSGAGFRHVYTVYFNFGTVALTVGTK